MNWHTIRTQYPHQWVLVDALEAHSDNNKRILDSMAVINCFTNSMKALQAYGRLHKKSPQRELYVLHTNKETLDIEQRFWFGVRFNAND